MSDDKGFPLPDPVTGYPLICVTLKIPDALQYRQDFIGHIWQLGKWWNWEQSGLPGDTRAKEAGEYWRDLLYEHLKIGDCPVDCCDDILAAIAALQAQTTSQGQLTLTRDVANQQVQSAGLRKIYADRYDGSPTSINPDAPTTDFGAAGDRFDALCAALTAFVYQFAKSQAEAVIASDITAFALLAGVAILLIPGLNLFFIAGAALALAAGGGIIGVTTATAVAALTDTAALDAVICYMRDTLSAQSVTEAHWSACLNSYPFTVGSHAAIICDFIKPTLATNYLPVLDMLGQAYSGTINGDPLPDCPCNPYTWEEFFDFKIDDQGWSIIGNEIPGVGIQSPGTGGTPYTVQVAALITWTDGTLTRVIATVSSTTADGGAFRGVYWPASANPPQIGYTSNTGNYTIDIVPNNPQPEIIAIQVSNASVPGTNTIITVTLRGTGTNPFA